jgi:hypothetical protein
MARRGDGIQLPPRGLPLSVPVVEASNVKLDCLHALADALHHELILRDGGASQATHVSLFPALPQTRGMLLWGRRPSVSFTRIRLRRESCSIVALSGDGGCTDQATFTRVLALSGRQPEWPGCRQALWSRGPRRPAVQKETPPGSRNHFPTGFTPTSSGALAVSGKLLTLKGAPVAQVDRAAVS